MPLHPEREGRLTASRHGQALGFGYDSAAKDWRKWHGLEEPDEFAVARMEHGVTHEADGIAAFEAHCGFLVDRTGDNQLWTPYEDWSGCTTDGLIEDWGVVEVKAPQSPYPEPPKAYWCQLQSQLFITQRRTGYLVAWHSDETSIWKTECSQGYWPTVEGLLKDYLTMLRGDKPVTRWKKPKLNLDMTWERVK